MSSLARLQRDFQQHVLGGDPGILGAVSATAEVPAETRLAVYSEAYRVRLIDALASTFPRLQHLIGEQEFAAVAQRYIDDHPSRFTSIRWFGDRLAASIRQSHASQPWLSELAHWEWTIAAAFDSHDATTIDVESLAAIAPSGWPALSFEFHPSMRCLQVQTNAPALFKALSEEQPPPEPRVLERPQSWLVWRQDLKTQYRSSSDSEAGALAAMIAGCTFEGMCDSLCDWYDAEEVPAEAAGMLKRWVVEGLVMGMK